MVCDNRRNYTPLADETRTGQLPYLTHDLVTISSLPGIMTYVSGLPGSLKLDGHASTKEKAQRTAWKAHAASTLGDLVVSVNLLRSWTRFHLLSGIFVLLVRQLLETHPTNACKDDARPTTILRAKPYQGIV